MRRHPTAELCPRKVRAVVRAVERWWRDQRGNQLVEFAVSLPLLVVFVVGIFDFSSAFTVKQKLAAITFEAARVGASQPTRDLTANGGNCNAPGTVCALRDVIDHALVQNKMNDCGLATANAAGAGAMAWQFTPTGSCPGALTVTIERGFTYTATLSGPFSFISTYRIEATRVTIAYPYQWQFSSVIRLLVPGANYARNSVIRNVAVMQNMN